jgi:hypothetical protein
MGRYSDLLYARPSFLGGMASVIDIGGTLVEYNDWLSPEQADFYALRADWCQVGDDLQRAIDTVGGEIPVPVALPDARSRREQRR